MRHRGFTLIEVVLLVLVLGILAILALPRYLDLSAEAELTAKDGVVGAVRAGIAMHRAREMIATGGEGSYPDSLDGVSNDTACGESAPCFSNVVVQPVEDSRWRKVNGTTYSFSSGTKVMTYRYDQNKGTFLP
jgi:type II secretory pathway pseudopilin PulG